MSNKRKPKLQRADRALQVSRAAKFKYKQIYAVTVICDGEQDQMDTFSELKASYPKKKIKVVVS